MLFPIEEVPYSKELEQDFAQLEKENANLTQQLQEAHTELAKYVKNDATSATARKVVESSQRRSASKANRKSKSARFITLE